MIQDRTTLAASQPASAGDSPIPSPAAASAPGRNVALDGWRCFACLLVYCFHKNINVNYGFVVVRGFTGVHMFFVLSGYLLSTPYLAAILAGRKLPSWRGYFQRRFLRIYPPYVVSLALFLAARALAHDKLPSFANLVGHLTLTFNYFDKSLFYSINAVYWSLAIEAQFYALLPVVCWVTARASARRPDAAVWGLLGLMLGVGVASRAAECLGASPRVDGVQYTAITSYLDWFAAGMAVAYLEQRASGWFRAVRWRGLAALAAGLALFLTANSWFGAVAARTGETEDVLLSVGFPTVVCVGLGLILLSVCCAPASRWSLLRLAPVVWIGNISYSFFLYHIGVQVAVQRAFPMRSIPLGFQNDLAQALASLPPALVVSAAMFYLVERPCLRAMVRLKARPKVDSRTP